MMFFIVLVIGACYLGRFLLSPRPESAIRSSTGTTRHRDEEVGSFPRPAHTDTASMEWTALDDHQLKRLLEQSAP